MREHLLNWSNQNYCIHLSKNNWTLSFSFVNSSTSHSHFFFFFLLTQFYSTIPLLLLHNQKFSPPLSTANDVLFWEHLKLRTKVVVGDTVKKIRRCGYVVVDLVVVVVTILSNLVINMMVEYWMPVVDRFRR